VTVPSALTAPQLRFVWGAVHDRYARQAADVPVHSITFTENPDFGIDLRPGKLTVA